MQTILLIAKSSSPSKVLEAQIAAAGFYPVIVEDFQTALLFIPQLSPSLIVLSDCVTNQSSILLCQAVRAVTDVPLLLLCSKAVDETVPLALGWGADVVLPTDTSIMTIVTQIEALQRRVEWEQKSVVEQMTQEKLQLLDNLLFDLKAPLSLVVDALEVQQSLEGEDGYVAMQRLQRQLVQLKQTYDDLLLLSQTTAPEPSSFLLETLFEEIEQSVWPKVNNLPERLRTFLPLEQMSLFADWSHVVCVLRHLLHNAVLFSEPHSPIFLHAERVSASHAELAVIDAGEGIDVSVQTAVFQKFFKVDPDSPGLGIGLAVVQKLALANNGAVQVESHIGQGSCFRIRLPLALPEQVSL